MSDDRYIKMVEAFEAEGYSYSKASKLAYEHQYERVLTEEEEEKLLAKINLKKQKSTNGDQ
jgi:hypothetical protein